VFTSSYKHYEKKFIQNSLCSKYSSIFPAAAFTTRKTYPTAPKNPNQKSLSYELKVQHSKFSVSFVPFRGLKKILLSCLPSNAVACPEQSRRVGGLKKTVSISVHPVRSKSPSVVTAPSVKTSNGVNLCLKIPLTQYELSQLKAKL